MQKGGRRLLCVPAILAYGATEQASIPANSALIFEIELTKHKGKDAKAAPEAKAPEPAPAPAPEPEPEEPAAPAEEDADQKKRALMERMMRVDQTVPQGPAAAPQQGMVFNQFGQPMQMPGGGGALQPYQPPPQQQQQVQMLYDQFGNVVGQQPAAAPQAQAQLFDQFGQPVPQRQRQQPQQQQPAAEPEPAPVADKALDAIAKGVAEANEKLDKIAKKDEQLLQYGSGMEAAVPMYTIQRLIPESERMKKELFERSGRIEQQNEKIADLLERNRKYVEENIERQEQHNDSFKATTAQAQARVLELEWDKSDRVEELTAATNRLAELQLELTALQRAESECRAQLAAARDEAARANEDLASLQAASGGSAAKLEGLTRAHKEERQLRKDQAQKMEVLGEELAEARAAAQVAAKKADDAKEGATADRLQLEAEIEELKGAHETAIEEVKRKARKERQGLDTDLTSKCAAPPLCTPSPC